MAGLTMKLTQEQINRRKKQFDMCTQEILNVTQRNDEPIGFLYF